jgi:hypothetical protein
MTYELRKTIFMTKIKLDPHFSIIAITQKIFAKFYFNLYPICLQNSSFQINLFPHPSSLSPSVIELIQSYTFPA